MVGYIDVLGVFRIYCKVVEFQCCNIWAIGCRNSVIECSHRYARWDYFDLEVYAG